MRRRSSTLWPSSAELLLDRRQRRAGVRARVDERERIVLDQIAVDPADHERRRDGEDVDAVGGRWHRGNPRDSPPKHHLACRCPCPPTPCRACEQRRLRRRLAPVRAAAGGGGADRGRRRVAPAGAPGRHRARAGGDRHRAERVDRHPPRSTGAGGALAGHGSRRRCRGGGRGAGGPAGRRLGRRAPGGRRRPRAARRPWSPRGWRPVRWPSPPLGAARACASGCRARCSGGHDHLPPAQRRALDGVGIALADRPVHPAPGPGLLPQPRRRAAAVARHAVGQRLLRPRADDRAAGLLRVRPLGPRPRARGAPRDRLVLAAALCALPILASATSARRCPTCCWRSGWPARDVRAAPRADRPPVGPRPRRGSASASRWAPSGTACRRSSSPSRSRGSASGGGRARRRAARRASWAAWGSGGIWLLRNLVEVGNPSSRSTRPCSTRPATWSPSASASRSPTTRRTSTSCSATCPRRSSRASGSSRSRWRSPRCRPSCGWLAGDAPGGRWPCWRPPSCWRWPMSPRRTPRWASRASLRRPTSTRATRCRR